MAIVFRPNPVIVPAIVLVFLLVSQTGAQNSSGNSLVAQLVAAALERTNHRVHYDGSYRKIAYPGGDVSDDRGVCTDVIIRCYRKIGIDLQVAVHEDMSVSFSEYPTLWGLTRPDPNIDHRRVPNLHAFFSRKGVVIPVTDNGDDYEPGDLVFWKLPSGHPHVGIVVNRRSQDGKRPLIVHNIGSGPMLEDVLFAYTINGHFRYPQEIWR